MVEAVSLLPSNSTPWETANDLTDAARWAEFDASVVSKVKDALLCDEAFLGVLGWERSVDLWFDDWSIEKKRHVVDKWYEYERLKGTVEGFRRFYRLAGAKLLKATLHPQGVYPRRNWTDAERQAYLAQFQQIRIYPKVPVKFSTGGFIPSTSNRSRAYVGRVWATSQRVGIDTTVREARLYDPETGEETVLTRREQVRQVTHVGTVYEWEDIVFPEKRFGFYVGDAVGPNAGDKFLGRSNAAERTMRLAIPRPYQVAVSRPQWSSVVPNSRLISIYPDLVRQTFRDRGSFLNHASTGKRSKIYAARNTAWKHVYERFYAYDRKRDRGVTAATPGQYVGHARLGMKPFTAEMKVEIRTKRQSWEFQNRPGQYLTPLNRETLDRTLKATRAAKAARDTIYLDTHTRRNLRFGDRITFGDRIVFGAKVET